MPIRVIVITLGVKLKLVLAKEKWSTDWNPIYTTEQGHYLDQGLSKSMFKHIAVLVVLTFASYSSTSGFLSRRSSCSDWIISGYHFILITKLAACENDGTVGPYVAFTRCILAS